MARRKRSIGRMRHRLTIMALTRSDDGGGGSSRADAVSATVWARVELASVKEVAAYSQLQQRTTHSVLIRQRDDVRQGSTVYWLSPGATEPDVGETTPPDGIALYVHSAIDDDPDGRPGEFLRLMCEQRAII